MQLATTGSYWDGFAQSYARLGPPLRPSADDIQIFERTIADWAAARSMRRVEALLLGVTPDIARMRWPSGTSLLAIDRSEPMVRTVWPGNIAGWREVVCADWVSLPRKKASCDVVIGDGSINCLPYPDGFRKVAETVASVLRPDGIFLLRVYLQSEPRETTDHVFADALDGRVSSFHAFKLRLLMAAQENAHEGVAVRDVYRSWAERKIDRERLPNVTGWQKHDVDTIDFYRDSSTTVL
jgi:SAM-dependent methyltransferase